MFGESAAITIGSSGNGPTACSWNVECQNCPSGTGSPASIARVICVYSRISLTGLRICWPCHCSTTGRWETPSPRTRRPPLASAIVAASIAIVAGVRV
ncbi:unannotated protein [freshwater metagenome]|uniref:Unannotated protein n=1 Tax=freshwater metagenome TaxID=449393 RepID=A0A6J7CUS6_9ZZZZ